MFGGLPGSKAKIGQSFPRGTTMPFYQAAAPVGWTKLTTHNDKALRVVSGSGGVSGGTNAFSTVMAQSVVGNTTLSAATIPSHAHAIDGNSGFAAATTTGSCAGTRMEVVANGSRSSGSIGSGGAHNHGITMDMQYIDVILAKKN
jgi:microcystin-dependent protein